MLGFGPNDPVSVSIILERIPMPYREEVATAVNRAHDPKGDGLLAIEHPIIGPGGQTRWISVRSQTFFEGGGSDRRCVRTIGAILDITEQKDHAAALTHLVQERTAKLKETVAELEHFSYTITHDMRAPLRAINSFADLLSSFHSQSLSDEARDLLGRISESAVRMDQLITDALRYSRAVREYFKLQPLDPAESIRGIIRSYPQFQLPHARITVQPEMPRVLANEAALTQVFSNLLGNAVKFVTPGHIPEITISAEKRGDFIRLWVADRGIGIPPEYHAKIWQMFERLDKHYEGTGIGLALVRKVVERIGGRVGVESFPGQGSRFWIELQSP
jgi:signal transduction histidine kinase